MHHRHPNFDTLFNYSSNTPAWQLTSDESAFVTEHVERCEQCRSIVKDIQDHDVLWDSLSLISEAERKAESLDEDIAVMRIALARSTRGRQPNLDRGKPGRHTYVKQTFGDLHFSSLSTLEDLAYAASTENIRAVSPSPDLQHSMSFMVQEIEVSVYLNPYSGNVFLSLPEEQFESLLIDEHRYELSFDDSSGLWEVVGLAFVDLDEFLQSAAHSNKHTLKLDVMR